MIGARAHVCVKPFVGVSVIIVNTVCDRNTCERLETGNTDAQAHYDFCLSIFVVNRQVFRCEKFAVLLTTGSLCRDCLALCGVANGRGWGWGGGGGPHIVPKQQLVVEALQWGGDSSVGKASD